MKNLYIIMAIIAALATGCRGYDAEEVLLPRNDISLTIKGETIMSYEENSCQIGFNDERKEFRVLDNMLTDWFILRCEQIPSSQGQTIRAELEYTTVDDVKSITGLRLSVKKINTEGMVWMWEEEKEMGIVIKLLE